MFTGIVTQVGRIKALQMQSNSMHLTIESDFLDLQLGESIAVDGICLTVSAIAPSQFCCQLSEETLVRSIARDYQPNQLVNLERALTLQDRLGGHLLSGHVDGVLSVSEKKSQGQFCQFSFADAPSQWMALLVEKGSVAINGVSLTVNTLGQDCFAVTLVPHTLAQTNLQALSVGSRVNVEFDQLAKMVARQVELQARALEET